MKIIVSAKPTCEQNPNMDCVEEILKISDRRGNCDGYCLFLFGVWKQIIIFKRLVALYFLLGLCFEPIRHRNGTQILHQIQETIIIG